MCTAPCFSISRGGWLRYDKNSENISPSIDRWNNYLTRIHAQEASDVVRLDPEADDVVPAGARTQQLAEGYAFLEGPVWVRKGGYLLFSDIPANVIDKRTPDGKVSVFIKPSGYTGSDPSQAGRTIDNGKATVNLIGSNAVTVDRQGRIVFCAQGDRSVVRIEKDGKRTVLADRYEGKATQ